MGTPAGADESIGGRQEVLEDIPRRFSAASHLVWGSVSLTGIAAAVGVLWWGSTEVWAAAEWRTPARLPVAPPRAAEKVTLYDLRV
jgi:hypothetical protein